MESFIFLVLILLIVGCLFAAISQIIAGFALFISSGRFKAGLDATSEMSADFIERFVKLVRR